MFTNKVANVLAKQYGDRVRYELMQVGLRYEDLLNEAQPSLQEAFQYAPKETVEARTRRLKRAIDLSFKRKSLLDYVPESSVEDPFKADIIPIMEKINKRDQEYVMYNMHNK